MPYDYDRHVPIVFAGPGIRPGTRQIECGPEDIAWALGRLLGLDYPKQDAEKGPAAFAPIELGAVGRRLSRGGEYGRGAAR